MFGNGCSECAAFERSVRTTPSEPRNWAAPPQARSPISRTAAAGASMHADSTHAQGRTHPLSCIGDAALLPISAAQYGALPACRWLIHRAPTSSPSARSGSGLRSRLENCSLLSEASRVGRLRFTVCWRTWPGLAALLDPGEQPLDRAHHHAARVARQKVGFDFGTCITQLRSSWQQIHRMGGQGAGQCGARAACCACAHEMRAARARRVAAAYGSACERL